MQLIILKLLLGYVHFALQSGIIEKVNGAVLGFFSLEAITKDTCTLFDKCKTLIGTYKFHRDGSTRSESDAHIMNIIMLWI